jgi:hypothetical protein
MTVLLSWSGAGELFAPARTKNVRGGGSLQEK